MKVGSNVENYPEPSFSYFYSFYHLKHLNHSERKESKRMILPKIEAFDDQTYIRKTLSTNKNKPKLKDA
jgi:hypothetical protein